MSHRAGSFLAVVVLVAAACGSNPVPPPSGAASQPAGSNADPAAIQTAVATLMATPPTVADFRRSDLQASLGLSDELGTNAAQILAVLNATEGAAIARQPIPSPGKPSASPAPSTAPSGARTSGVILAVAPLHSLPVPPTIPTDNELRGILASDADSVGRPGANSIHEDTGTQVDNEADGGTSGSTSISTSYDVTISGSSITVDTHRNLHTVVTDTASGSTILDATTTLLASGTIDICPTAAGVVKASVSHDYAVTAVTFPSKAGGVGTNTTGSYKSASTFTGQVDDQANLGKVTQTDYTHDQKWKRTAAAAGATPATHEGGFHTSMGGIDYGVPSAHDWSVAIGDWSTATGLVEQSGDATSAQMYGSTIFSAAIDFSVLDAAYLAAQHLWRNGRCLMVRAPDYNAETEIDTASQGSISHTENVDKGSTTVFKVALKHRFGAGINVTPIKASLFKGSVTIAPDTLPSPPGSLTYTAPDENGKDAVVALIATSRQGIAKLGLDFHTGQQKLEISITGTSTTSGFGVSYVTTLSVPSVVISAQPDGSLSGSGPVSATMTVARIPCPTPFHETGTVIFTGTREVIAEDPTNPAREWFIDYSKDSKVLATGSCLGISLGSLVAVGPDGNAGVLLAALGQLKISGSGGTYTFKTTKTFGPATVVISATVKARVLSGDAK